MLTTLFSIASLSAPHTCGDIKSLYQSSSCCGNASSTPIQSSIIPNDFDVSDLLALEANSPRAPFRVALSSNRVAQNDNVFTALVAAEGTLGLTHVSTVPWRPFVNLSTGAAVNFWHSMSLDEDTLYIGVRDSGKIFVVDQNGGSGVYAIDRETLAVKDKFQVGEFNFMVDAFTAGKGSLMRWAPVVADGHVFSTTWGIFFGDGKLYKANASDLSQYTEKDMRAFFGITNPDDGINGPVASATLSGDDECGTRLIVTSSGLNNAGPYSFHDQTRPMGIDNLVNARGRLGCICSKTMESCWKESDGSDKYFWNGKPYHAEPIALVGPEHVNTARSDFVGTVRPVSCASMGEAVSVSRVIPEYFEVSLDTVVPPGTVLTSGAVRLVVVAHPPAAPPVHTTTGTEIPAWMVGEKYVAWAGGFNSRSRGARRPSYRRRFWEASRLPCST